MLTGMTQQIRRAYEICIAFHERGVYSVIGGIHAAIYPWEALEYADTVMVGEGEELIPQFLSDFYHGEPKKIYKSLHFCKLEKSPPPRYDLVNPRLYSSYSIQTTRGCPHTCSYCTLPVMYGSVYRHKTVEQVINEIHQIKKVQDSPLCFLCRRQYVYRWPIFCESACRNSEREYCLGYADRYRHRQNLTY
ncbi:MAG: B12-binding domain-containing radical SAM protein [Clostridia bacterium]